MLTALTLTDYVCLWLLYRHISCSRLYYCRHLRLHCQSLLFNLAFSLWIHSPLWLKQTINEWMHCSCWFIFYKRAKHTKNLHWDVEKRNSLLRWKSKNSLRWVRRSLRIISVCCAETKSLTNRCLTANALWLFFSSRPFLLSISDSTCLVRRSFQGATKTQSIENIETVSMGANCERM